MGRSRVRPAGTPTYRFMAAKPLRTFRSFTGFAAMNRYVGVPAGRTRDLPIINLYLLWSIERVAVLYDLPTIAGKDWYRWGAEVLVANQSDQGDWPDGGGYYGAKPPINTSLSLLFLRRANLVSDLTTLLPFKPDELTEAITNTVTPPKEKQPAAAALVKAPPGPPPAPAAITGLTGQDPAAAAASAQPPAPVNDADLRTRTSASDRGGRGWIVLVLILVALLLLAAAGGVLYLHFRNRTKETKGPKEAKRKKGGAKRLTRLKADPAPASKPKGKSRLHA